MVHGINGSDWGSVDDTFWRASINWVLSASEHFLTSSVAQFSDLSGLLLKSRLHRVNWNFVNATECLLATVKQYVRQSRRDTCVCIWARKCKAFI